MLCRSVENSFSLIDIFIEKFQQNMSQNRKNEDDEEMTIVHLQMKTLKRINAAYPIPFVLEVFNDNEIV